MKIFVLAPEPFFQNRGTPIATLKLLKLLSLQGHHVDLLTYAEGDPVQVANCHHFRIRQLTGIRNIRPGFSLKKVVCDLVMLVYAIRMCRRQRYDLVHAVEESVFIAMLLKLLYGLPYIYDMDSSLPQQLQDQLPWLKPLGPILRYFEGLAIRHSQGVVAVCQSLERIAASHTDHVPILRVEDASLVAVNRLAQTGQSVSESSQLTIPHPIVMYVGNLQPYQGLDLLLDAFVHVFHENSAAQLVVVGGAEEDIHRYRSRAAEFAVLERVHFLGPRPIAELGQVLLQADILVSPRTLGSNTPMKIFSYLESGRPVLATRLPTHTQILDDEIAYLVRPTPLDMARGLLDLLDSPELRASIAERARERLRRDYSSELLETKLGHFYQELEESLFRPARPQAR
jgi:glycosyltransferase involved in cell wall biosynthesis